LTDKLTVPLQLQILEPDFLDTSKEGPTASGGFIKQGIEFDARGLRVAYWMFQEHPGASFFNVYGKSFLSKPIPAEDIKHIYYVDRPGQIRGVSWFAPVAVRMHDFDDFEDATLLRQKIAACFAAFVTDPEGVPGGLGKSNVAPDDLVETIEPGMVNYLKPAQEVTFASPPMVSDSTYCARVLRSVAVGFGITYEQLTGDLTGVNFSSGKMGQLEFQNNVEDWRWNMLIPHGCQGIWDWFITAGQVSGLFENYISAKWTPPPYRMIDPPKEIKALKDKVRSGFTSLSEAIREQGFEPEDLFNEMRSDNESLDSRGLIVDTDPRKISLSGGEQPNYPDKPNDSSASGEDQ